MRSLLHPGIATRLVLGVNLLILLVVSAFAIIIGSLMRARMFRTIDLELAQHGRVYNVLIQKDQEFLMEEAMVIRYSDGMDPALAARNASALRRVLRPFILSHEFDAAYVLDSDGVILAQTGVVMADPERVVALPIVERAKQGVWSADAFVLDDTIWIGAATAHRTKPDNRIDAVILLGQRIDGAHLKAIQSMLGPAVALTLHDHSVQSFESLPSGAPVAQLPSDPTSGAEYAENGQAYQSIVVGDRTYRRAAFAAATRGGAPLTLFVFEDTERVNGSLYMAFWQVVSVGMLVMLVSSAVSLIYARQVVKPLERLASSAQAIAQGRFDQAVDTRAADEVGRLAAAFEQMRTRLRQMMAEQQSWAAAMEERVRAKTAELQALGDLRDELLHRIISAREEENRRVARELHDETSQNLTAMIAMLGALRQMPPEQARARTAELRPLLADTLNGIKRIMLDLRPALLDDQGLAPALRWYAHERLEQNGIAVRIHVDGCEQRLPPEMETCLFRIGQEAISNIVRHARARRVEIQFLFAGDEMRPEVTVRISDDGRGFNPAQVAPRGPGAERHLGLLGMRERADLIGGSVDVQSSPGAGTQVCVRAAAPASITEPENKP